MNLRTCLLAVCLLALACNAALAMNASESANMKALIPGTAVPDLTFPTTELTPAQAKDLGVAAGAPFKLDRVKADAVILVVYSMYCPFCQKEAPELVKLHEMIAQKGLADKVKLVGLGAGNSPFEVKVFREKFNIGFALFPDQDFTAYKALGQVGTPFYYLLKRSGAGFTVVGNQLGCVTSAQAYLDDALGRLGLGAGK